MPISQDQRDLFRIPHTADKLNLLQSLSDSKDLTSDQALAWINIIRAELEQPQRQNASTYRRYAEVTASLRGQMPEVYEQMVNAWQQRRPGGASAEGPPSPLLQESRKAASEADEEREAEVKEVEAASAPEAEAESPLESME